MSNLIFTFLMCWFGIGTFINVMSIGKERRPLTPADIVVQLIGMALIVWAIASHWDWS